MLSDDGDTARDRQDSQDGEEELNESNDEYDLNDPFIDDIESGSEEESTSGQQEDALSEANMSLGLGEAIPTQMIPKREPARVAVISSSPLRQAETSKRTGIQPEEQQGLRSLAMAKEEERDVPAMPYLNVSSKWESESHLQAYGQGDSQHSACLLLYSPAPL